MDQYLKVDQWKKKSETESKKDEEQKEDQKEDQREDQKEGQKEDQWVAESRGVDFHQITLGD